MSCCVLLTSSTSPSKSSWLSSSPSWRYASILLSRNFFRASALKSSFTYYIEAYIMIHLSLFLIVICSALLSLALQDIPIDNTHKHRQHRIWKPKRRQQIRGMRIWNRGRSQNHQFKDFVEFHMIKCFEKRFCYDKQSRTHCPLKPYNVKLILIVVVVCTLYLYVHCTFSVVCTFFCMYIVHFQLYVHFSIGGPSLLPNVHQTIQATALLYQEKNTQNKFV